MAPQKSCQPRSARGKRADLSSWLDRNRPERIGEPELAELRQKLAPVSEGYLRKLLRESGVELTPMVAGVRQSSLDELEASLLALLGEYEGGDAARRTAVRKLVITAKDHARWAGKKEEELWIVTWLENPPLFPEWITLRRRAIDSR